METLPNHIIFREAEAALKRGKLVSLRVVGKSMEPFLIDNKDIVRITSFTSGNLRRGDIVLYKVDGVYCFHRIIQIKGNHVILRGDGVYLSKERIIEENIIGVLDSVIRESGDVIACNSIKWKINSYAWMILFPIRKYLLYVYHKQCFVKRG